MTRNLNLAHFMKQTLVLLLTLASLASAKAQGTIQFLVNLSGANEVPTNDSGATGTGTFTLSSNSLSYGFGDLFNTANANIGPASKATINGPAEATATAPVLFDLGAPGIAVPNPPDPGGYWFSGTVNNLTSGEIQDLSAGLWYVNVTSLNYPDGIIRGQIVLAPEPATWSLLVSGAASLVWFGRKDRAAR